MLTVQTAVVRQGRVSLARSKVCFGNLLEMIACYSPEDMARYYARLDPFQSEPEIHHPEAILTALGYE